MVVSTTVVTVTYGRRLDLLAQTLAAAQVSGAANCIVVDNGSSEPIAKYLEQHFGTWATTVCMGRNTGSAGGFKRGIEEAIRRGAEYILLLDDDNVVASDCLHQLAAAFVKAQADHPRDLLALQAYRPDHLKYRVDEASTGRVARLESSFFGFHLFDLPRKVVWRLHASADKKTGMDVIPIPTAIYGGLLFHRSMIDRIGLPDERFVLYGDDIDFTHRIVQAGGTVLLVLNALVADIDKTWHLKLKAGPRFIVWITGDSDFRAFYSFRNGSFYARSQCKDKRLMFWVNLVCYVAMLGTASIAFGRLRRFHLLMKALSDGLRGRLGENASFPLIS